MWVAKVYIARICDGSFSHVVSSTFAAAHIHEPYVNVYEPAHDKTYKMVCAPSEDSDQSLRCRHEESFGLSYPLSTLRGL